MEKQTVGRPMMRSCSECHKFDTLKTIYERVPKVIPRWEGSEYTKTVYQFQAIGTRCGNCDKIELFKNLDNNMRPQV